MNNTRIKDLMHAFASTRLWRDHLSRTRAGYHLGRIGTRFVGQLDEQKRERGDFIISQHPLEEARTRILLIQLPLPANKRHKKVVPIGIASLAAYLIKHDPELNVAILDAQVHDLNLEQILQEVRRCSWDIVGISYWTVQRKKAALLSRAIAQSGQASLLVHGGVHPSIRPAEALEHADLCVLGEGEKTFFEVVKAHQAGRSLSSVQGVALLEGGKVLCTPKRGMSELDELPMPAWHLLPVDEYTTQLHLVGGRRWPIVGSRGCPYNCSFCVSPLIWERTVRFRSPKTIVAEMKHIAQRYGISQFHFWDDNFTINTAHTEELCRELIREKLDFKWVCLDRAELINKNRRLLPLMREAGCIGVEIGLESANPDTFLYIKKDQDIDQSTNAISNLREAGIVPMYTCMAFNPGESIVGYYLQKDFLDKAQEGLPWHAYFHPLPFPVYIGQFATPYPGTGYGEEIEKTSMVLLDDEEDLFHHQINAIPYSLLEDVPVAAGALGDDDLSVLLLATKAAFYRMFDAEEDVRLVERKLVAAGRFYLAFVAKCTGRLTLGQIAGQLQVELGVAKHYSYRLVAFAAYILGQFGMIRSAVQQVALPLHRKCIDLPASCRIEVAQVLKGIHAETGQR